MIAADAAQANPAKAQDDFMPHVQLAPFVVQGRQLTISIHARSNRDRRYAEAFAEDVAKVVYEGVTPETGKGLVIIGKKGEPHPITVFRQFLELAEAGKLDPTVAARAGELTVALDNWEDTIEHGGSSEGGVKVNPKAENDPEFERIVTALPLPLEGIGAKLYQLAWREEFEARRVEARLCALRASDLEGNLFVRFDWVFYLPPRGAFERAINDIVADALKEEQVGFFTRTLVKGVMLTVKGEIRQTVEAMRRGIMFATVVKACTEFRGEQVSTLTKAYIDELLPEHGGSRGSGPEHERAVRAVQNQVQVLRQAAAATRVAGAPQPRRPRRARNSPAAPASS
jgi:hypothetical protein